MVDQSDFAIFPMTLPSLLVRRHISEQFEEQGSQGTATNEPSWSVYLKISIPPSGGLSNTYLSGEPLNLSTLQLW